MLALPLMIATTASATTALPRAGQARAGQARAGQARGLAAGQARGLAAGQARGLDVSAYQHDGGAINWPLLARAGLRFVAIKASEGTYYTNPYYVSDARAAAAAGLSVLPYVFANPRRAPGAATARFAIAAAHYPRVAARGAGPARNRRGAKRVRRAQGARGARATRDLRLPLEVDLENNPYAATDRTGDCYGLTVRQVIAWIAAFTAQTARLTGKAPIIYTTAGWWRECAGNTALFGRDPLWLAAYDTAAPGVPSPWKRWTFWQYDEDAMVPGVGLTDLDVYQATTALPALRQPAAKSARPRHRRRNSR